MELLKGGHRITFSFNFFVILLHTTVVDYVKVAKIVHHEFCISQRINRVDVLRSFDIQCICTRLGSIFLCRAAIDCLHPETWNICKSSIAKAPFGSSVINAWGANSNE